MSDISEQFPLIITTMITVPVAAVNCFRPYMNGTYTYTYTACEINTHTMSVWYPNQLTTRCYSTKHALIALQYDVIPLLTSIIIQYED